MHRPRRCVWGGFLPSLGRLVACICTPLRRRLVVSASKPPAPLVLCLHPGLHPDDCCPLLQLLLSL